MRPVSTLSHHVPALDGLRALAIFSVLFGHVFFGYFEGGFLGVDLFFVLSGYLITGLLINEFVETGTFRLDYFYLRRLCRLMPALVCAVLLAVLVGRIVFSSSDPSQLSWMAAFVTLTGLANYYWSDSMALIGVVWSLSVEEQFYWFWPPLLRILLKVRQGKYLVGVIIGLILFANVLRSVLFLRGVIPNVLYCCTFTRMDSLFMGALAFLASSSVEVRHVAGVLSRYRVPEMILLGWILLLPCISAKSTFLSFGGSSLIAIVFSIFLLCVIFQKTKTMLIAFLESYPAQWLGKRSYGVYLYHVPIMALLNLFLVKRGHFNHLSIYTLKFIVPMVVAALSYKYIEMPFLRLKDRLHAEKKVDLKMAGV